MRIRAIVPPIPTPIWRRFLTKPPPWTSVEMQPRAVLMESLPLQWTSLAARTGLVNRGGSEIVGIKALTFMTCWLILTWNG